MTTTMTIDDDPSDDQAIDDEPVGEVDDPVTVGR